MSFGTILYTLLIGPLELAFEVIYSLAYKSINNPGLAIVVLSLVVNILVLPLYKRADAIQEEERQTQKRLERGVNHIKKTFKGDERMMMLQTYYRQNNYKPTYVLRSATSLLLQIPFFIAAYNFLSGLQLLNGMSFGPIADLAKPDGLLFGINVLPILMTLINMVSTIIFTKGYPLKDKIQLYGMALFFLVFLYDSPAGLVFYWTLNNMFSLVKTIFYKLKNPGKVLRILLSAFGAVILVAGIPAYTGPSVMKAAMFGGMGLAMQLPIVLVAVQRRYAIDMSGRFKNCTANQKYFAWGVCFLTVLTGMLIPTNVIHASTQEFVDVVQFYHPIWHVVSACCYAAGFFIIWLGVFYWLASQRGKVIFERTVWLLCGIALLNYMAFGKNIGTLSSLLEYDAGINFPRAAQMINLFCCALAACIGALLIFRFEKPIFGVLKTGTAAILIMALVNVFGISTEVSQISFAKAEEAQHFPLSKRGKNVVVIMLDRALNEMVPYIFREKPELQKQFSGFTYYENVSSFGGGTNVASPSLFGGYEYTPWEINKRADERLADKQNEAIRVLPVLFDNNGYDVTVYNPTYANYSEIPDLSIYDEYPSIHAYSTQDQYAGAEYKESCITSNRRNFFCYSITKIAPLAVQKMLYDNGSYNRLDRYNAFSYSTPQVMDSLHTAKGMSYSFLDAYGVLSSLPFLSTPINDEENTFMVMSNDTTHSKQLLQLPDYELINEVDNTPYVESYQSHVVAGRKLRLESEEQILHYHINMAAMIQLGEWFDYLRSNGVYDNTRIILVADHGRYLNCIDELNMDLGNGRMLDAGYFCPLLMVKDFDATEYTVSHTYMTNADVPTLAVEGLIENPMNPFTGKEINNVEKTAHNQYIMDSNDWIVSENNGNQFLPGCWYSVHDDIWDANNWALVAEGAVFPFED